ncbi:MAG TPA: ABC transporter ATP-binding protein [Ideonella sp.]|nr:ABC transporter ATP-binding protein [Ideonella sp.]
MNGDPLLEARGVQAGYGPLRVLHGLDFSLQAGTVTALLGANGAGKSSTLRALCAMLPTQGEVRFDGERIERRTTEAIARLGIAHVPEGRGSFVDLSVEENLRLGGCMQPVGRHALEADLARVYGWFPRLAERRRQMAGTLSGGEQQMLAFSRAMMMRPRLLLLDEPSFGLAPRVVESLFHTVRLLRETEGLTVLLVEQNAAMALALADQALVLQAGRIVQAGPADEVRRAGVVHSAYLGA